MLFFFCHFVQFVFMYIFCLHKNYDFPIALAIFQLQNIRFLTKRKSSRLVRDIKMDNLVNGKEIAKTVMSNAKKTYETRTNVQEMEI